MIRQRLLVVALVAVSLVLLASSFLVLRPTAAPSIDLTPTAFSYLPVVVHRPCPCTSPNHYQSGTALQYDTDNPVRPAYNHADKNIELRGYVAATDPSLRRRLVDYGCDDPNAPQLATLFSPARVPSLEEIYHVRNWSWASSPDPGHRAGPISTPPVTALGLGTTRGETLHVPQSGYDIGGGMEVIVLFADKDTLALRYTREDSSAPPGYTVHIDNICTDPNLLNLYNDLDDPNGPRYVYGPPDEYPLPALPAGKPLGTARGGEIVVAISDTGAFQDPRSLEEFWRIRPGYASQVSRLSECDYTKKGTSPYSGFLTTGRLTVQGSTTSQAGRSQTLPAPSSTNATP